MIAHASLSRISGGCEAELRQYASPPRLVSTWLMAETLEIRELIKFYAIKVVQVEDGTV
jgi:hypothetical protein